MSKDEKYLYLNFRYMFLESIQGKIYIDYLILSIIPMCQIYITWRVGNAPCHFLIFKNQYFYSVAKTKKQTNKKTQQFHSKPRSNRMQGFNWCSMLLIFLYCWLIDFIECFVTTKLIAWDLHLLLSTFYSSDLLTILYNMTNLVSPVFKMDAQIANFHIGK